jgi:hypothetical protein
VRFGAVLHSFMSSPSAECPIMHAIQRFVAAVLLFATLPLAAQTPQGTAFTYQGELRQNNQPFTGAVDMVFTLYDSAGGTTVIGSPIQMTSGNGNPVQVANGIFTATLDFTGTPFFTVGDDARWLEVQVANNILSPRTKIENAPYALTSQLAYNVPASSIGATQIIPAQVQQRVTGSCGTGSAISVINQNGTVSCQSSSGTISGVTPASGSGLTGGGTTGSVSLGTDLSVLQKRVGGTCPSGWSISAVNADGTVACQATGTGTVTSITTGNGLTGGTITSTGTIGVDTSVVALNANTWSSNGNAGVTSGFLGTTDGNPLTFKVAGVTAGRLQPTTPTSGYFDLPNVIFGSSVNNVSPGASGATIGGGGGNSTAGAYINAVASSWGTVSGGSSNGVGGFGGFIGGGNANSANGTYSVVGGGQLNLASGAGAVVPGGYVNKAGATSSLAAGSYAHVRDATEAGGSADDGTFVWSDATGSSANQFTSSGANQFLVRAGSGVGINTTPLNSEAELTIRGSATAASSNADITLLPRSSNYGFNLSAIAGATAAATTFAIETTNGYASYFAIDATGNVTVNQGNLTLAGTTAQAYKPGGGSWSAPSDARLKRDIQPLDHMLDTLLQLRGVTFEYARPDDNLHPAGRHTGFIAQEVQQVFPDWVGHTADGYLSVGPQGFEAMTVEALRELRAEKDAEIADLRNQLNELDARVRELARRQGAQP